MLPRSSAGVEPALPLRRQPVDATPGAAPAASLLLMLLFVAGVAWTDWPSGWDHLGAVPFAGMLAACSVVLAWGLAQLFAERRRYHEEWGRLPIELPS